MSYDAICFMPKKNVRIIELEKSHLQLIVSCESAFSSASSKIFPSVNRNEA